VEKLKRTNIHDPSSIKFYDEYQPYYIFTNFYENAPIIINGLLFKTAEHYYQWQKFNDPIIRQRIVNAPTARMSSDIARNNKYLIMPDFNKNKNEAMLKALRAKFSQHPDLGQELVQTGNRQLIEHSMYDDYWADGGDGGGLNNLGKLLMKVRQELQSGILTYATPYTG
jgi:hypothetical protein